MRLVLVSQEYPPETAHGGIATQTWRKAHGLAARGHEVRVLSHATDRRRHEGEDRGVRVVRLPGPDARQVVRTDAARWLLWSAEVAEELERWRGGAPFDLVDFPDWGAEGYVHLLNRHRGDRPRAVVHLQGPLALLRATLGWPEPGSSLAEVGGLLEGTCLQRADAVYSSSAFSAACVADAYGLDPARIPVAHVGVDAEAFRPAAAPPHNPTVVFAGRISRSKGADVLVDAALLLAREMPDLRVRLVGRDEGGLAGTLLERARAAGHPDLLEMAGFVPHDRLPALLADGHVFAAPSPCEGGPGFVWLEAMASGLPAIACEGTGVAEVIRPGETGLLVPRGDPVALAAALRSLLEGEPRRAAMAARARAYAVHEADTRVAVGRIEAFYESVLARDGAP